MIHYTQFNTALSNTHMSQKVSGSTKGFEFTTKGGLNIGDRIAIVHPSDEDPIFGYIVGLEGHRLPMTLLVAAYFGVGTIHFDGRWGDLQLEDYVLWDDCKPIVTKYDRFLQCSLEDLASAFKDNLDMFDADGTLYEEVLDVLELPSLSPQIKQCYDQSTDHKDENSLDSEDHRPQRTPFMPPYGYNHPPFGYPHPQQPYDGDVLPQGYNPHCEPMPGYRQPDSAFGYPHGSPESPMNHQPWSNPYQEKTYQELSEE